jgi:hypothetical protein
MSEQNRRNNWPQKCRRNCPKKCCACRFPLPLPRSYGSRNTGGCLWGERAQIFQGHKGRHQCRRQIEMMDVIFKPDI